MIELRRKLLKGGSAALIAPLLGTGLLLPGKVLAAEWNRNAFTARQAADALKAYGVTNATESRDIVINAPEIAENGAKIEIDVSSNVPNTRSIAVFADKNPMPLCNTLKVWMKCIGKVWPFSSLRCPVSIGCCIRMRRSVISP